MTLVRAVDVSAYLTDHGTVMVRDRYGPDGTRVRPPLTSSVLAESDGSMDPTGTIVRAGIGWLAAVGGDLTEAVRLEFHDHAPDDADDGWDKIVETPYFCGTGVVEMAWLTGSGGLPGIELASPGIYRVCACRTTGRWLFRFASTDGEIVPPRWVRRRVRPGSDRSESLIGRADRLDYGSLSVDLLSIVAWVESLTTSLADLADRLLAPVAVIPGLLDYTVKKGMIVRDGYRDAEFRLSLSRGERGRPATVSPPSSTPVARSSPAVRSGPRASRTERPGRTLAADFVETGASGANVAARLHVVGGWASSTDAADRLPDTGAPPRAGIVAADGNVVRWRDGEPEILGWLPPDRWRGALECAFGVVVLGSDAVVLVRPPAGRSSTWATDTRPASPWSARTAGSSRMLSATTSAKLPHGCTW